MKKYGKELLDLNKRTFHDSVLKKISFNQDLSVLEVVLESQNSSRWRLIFSGMLRFEFETTGTGVTQFEPIDIYEVYIEDVSDEKERWESRMKVLDIESEVYHVILCSSYLRGLLHDKFDMEGIQIFCRKIEVELISGFL